MDIPETMRLRNDIFQVMLEVLHFASLRIALQVFSSAQRSTPCRVNLDNAVGAILAIVPNRSREWQGLSWR